MPGTHLLVVPADRVFEDKPDFLLVLAWNFFSEITRQLAAYEEQGGQFLVPIPFPQVEMGSSKTSEGGVA